MMCTNVRKEETVLAINYYGAHFISCYGCKEYFGHSKELLFHERQKEIIRKLEDLALEEQAMSIAGFG